MKPIVPMSEAGTPIRSPAVAPPEREENQCFKECLRHQRQAVSVSQLSPVPQALQVHSSAWARFCCLGRPGLESKLTVDSECTGAIGRGSVGRRTWGMEIGLPVWHACLSCLSICLSLYLSISIISISISRSIISISIYL